MEGSDTANSSSTTLHILGMAIDIPPRSRLYSPPPEGLGTPYVESLTGYLTRLAEEHCLYPAKLITLEILPLLRGRLMSEPKAEYMSTQLSRNGLACNGMGELARSFVQALEELTLRKSLHTLTLLVWESVLAWEGLLRRTRAWCPTCYEEQSKTETPVYDHLLWALDAVTICPKHHRLLETTCPNEKCGRTMPVLTSRMRPGRCSWCDQWLGSPPRQLEATSTEVTNKLGEITEAAWQWQMWVAESMGELLAGVANVRAAPRPENVPAALKACQQKLGYRSLRAFCLARGLEYKTVLGWQQEGHLPPMKPLLRLCYSLGTTPFKFLMGGAEVAESVADNLGGLHLVPQARKRQPKAQLQEEHVRRYLEGVLQGNEFPPPSMREVGKRLGYMPYSLKRYFPEECQNITARHRTYLAERKSARERQVADELRRTVLSLLEEGEYPSRAQVAARLTNPADMIRLETRKAWREILDELVFRR